MPPAIYYLGGILVRATTKAIKDRLIAQGFRKATKGQIDSKIPVVTGTENNLIALITRAKNAIKSGRVVGSGGRNVARRKKPEEGNLLGNRGQSEFARKYGKRKMGGFGPVKSTRVKEAKDLKLAEAKRAKAKAESKPPTIKISGGSKPSPVSKPSAAAKPAPAKANQQPRLSSGPTIAGLVGAGAIGTVVYEAFSGNKSPTVTEIKAEAKKQNLTLSPKVIEYIKERRRKIAEANKKTTASNRALYADRSRKSTLENKRGFEPKTKKETEKKPIRPKLRPRVVEAKPMSLKEYLNAEIKSRKSTATKEIAKAKKGNYTSIASAKKAKSLYYMKDGKPMAAVYKRDLKGL